MSVTWHFYVEPAGTRIFEEELINLPVANNAEAEVRHAIKRHKNQHSLANEQKDANCLLDDHGYADGLCVIWVPTVSTICGLVYAYLPLDRGNPGSAVVALQVGVTRQRKLTRHVRRTAQLRLQSWLERW